MKQFSIKKQEGFSVLAIILVIVAVIVAIGIWSLSGQNNTSNYSEKGKELVVAALFNDAATLKLEYDSVVIRGQDPFSALTPEYEGLERVSPNQPFYLKRPVNPNILIPDDINYPDQRLWMLGSITGNNIGTNATDLALVIVGVKQEFCTQINKTINQTNTIPTVSISPNLVSSGRNPSFNPPDLSSVNAVSGWMEGCLGTDRGVDNNMFFRIISVK